MLIQYCRGYDYTTKSILLQKSLFLEDTNDSTELIQEAEIMKKINSNHYVVSLFGCNTLQEPYYILLEYAQYGDLKEYLIDKRENVCDLLIFFYVNILSRYISHKYTKIIYQNQNHILITYY